MPEGWRKRHALAPQNPSSPPITVPRWCGRSRTHRADALSFGAADCGEPGCRDVTAGSAPRCPIGLRGRGAGQGEVPRHAPGAPVRGLDLRSALRRPHAAQEPGVHGSGRSDAGPRHRRQHRDFPVARCSALAHGSGEGSARTRAGPTGGQNRMEGKPVDVVPGPHQPDLGAVPG